jgi:hypothetical protein
MKDPVYDLGRTADPSLGLTLQNTSEIMRLECAGGSLPAIHRSGI